MLQTLGKSARHSHQNYTYKGLLKAFCRAVTEHAGLDTKPGLNSRGEMFDDRAQAADPLPADARMQKTPQ
jgi:hypothetical protein